MKCIQLLVTFRVSSAAADYFFVSMILPKKKTLGSIALSTSTINYLRYFSLNIFSKFFFMVDRASEKNLVHLSSERKYVFDRITGI